MQFSYIAARAVAAAVVLNSGASFAEDHLSSASGDRGLDATRTLVGKLACLQEYVAKGSHATSKDTTSTSKDTTSTSRGGSDPTQPGTFAGTAQATQPGTFAGTAQATQPGTFAGTAQATQPGTLAGTAQAPGSVRSDAAVQSARDQGSRGSAKADAARYSNTDKASSESSLGKTLVLITQRGGAQGTEAASASPRVTSSTAGQTPFGQPRSETRNLPTASASVASGQPYILFFADDASGQSAYAKARGLITDGSSNWAASDTDTSDRPQGRSEELSDSAKRAQQPLANAPTARADQKEKDTGLKGSKDMSQVKVTGKIMNRGGIHGIQVSDISVASLQNASTSGANPSYAERATPDREKNSERE